MDGWSLKPGPQSLGLRHIHIQVHMLQILFPEARIGSTAAPPSASPISAGEEGASGLHIGEPTEAAAPMGLGGCWGKSQANDGGRVNARAALPPFPARGGEDWASRQDEVRTYQPWVVLGRKDWSRGGPGAYRRPTSF